MSKAVKGPIYIPSGCTILNLFLSGLADGGWMAGKIGHIVGDSDTGKSLKLLTTMAAVAHDPRFKRYDLILDDVEQSNEFNIPEMFGELDSRLTGPSGDATASYYVEDFYAAMLRILDEKKPFVYGLDSMDALRDLKEDEKARKAAEQHESDKDPEDGEKAAKGSYGMGKAKQNSDGLGRVKAGLTNTDSLLLIVSQTRDQIGLSFATKTHSGGRALKFYSCYQMWLAVDHQIKRSIEGKDRVVGTMVRVKITKNHATGRHGEFALPMYYGYGIDDIRCTVEWLVSEKWWKLSKGTLTTRKEIDGKEDWKLADFVKTIIPRVGELNAVAQTAWDAIESAIRRPGRWSTATEPGVEEFEE